MSVYVEDNNNTAFQIFHEFTEFLDCVYYFHKSDNKHIRNMALSSIRFHAREIADFFKVSKNKCDDLIYTDILDTEDNMSISISSDMRRFINKSTIHITSERGNLPFDNKEFFELIKQLVLKIKAFMDRCEKSLKPEYQKDFQAEDVEIQKKFINERLIQVAKCLIPP